MIYIFYIERIFLEQKKKDIPRILLEYECIFCWVNVRFYDAVNIIHDFIRTANPFIYIANHSCLQELEIIKLNIADVER